MMILASASEAEPATLSIYGAPGNGGRAHARTVEFRPLCPRVALSPTGEPLYLKIENGR